jgi:hypothetical protein
VLAAATAMAGCVHMPNANPLAAGGINPDSTVAAEVAAVSHAPGSYPRFAEIPSLPTDVRPVPAWRTAVITEWGQKRKTEHEAAALPFTLNNTSTEAWAEKTRRRIPQSETMQPAPDATQQSEAFAAAERARATPPSPPQ